MIKAFSTEETLTERQTKALAYIREHNGEVNVSEIADHFNWTYWMTQFYLRDLTLLNFLKDRGHVYALKEKKND